MHGWSMRMKITNLCAFDKTQEKYPSLKLPDRFAICCNICGGGSHSVRQIPVHLALVSLMITRCLEDQLLFPQCWYFGELS